MFGGADKVEFSASISEDGVCDFKRVDSDKGTGWGVFTVESFGVSFGEED
jgi:hypothetical protein